MAEVSVIIPTFNRAATLEKAVISVLNQTYPVYEVLVCDDGSTDDSRKIIAAIGDNRIRWVDGPRGGRPAIPRNRGIRESKGEWLAFLDDDDEWLSEKLEKQVTLVRKLGCQAACSNAKRFVPSQGIVGLCIALEHERITFDDLLRVNQVICSSALVHKSLVTSVKGFPEDEQLKAVEDYALWLRIASMTDFAFVTEPLVIYRDDPGNSIRGAEGKYWHQRKTVLSDFLHWNQEANAKCSPLRRNMRVLSRYLFASMAALTKKALLGKRQINKIAEDYVSNIPFCSQENINCDTDQWPISDLDVIDIVTVAFNNEQVVEEQIRLLNKYLRDNFHYTVADNSPDPDKRRKIKDICLKRGVSYFTLPPNPFTGNASSHSHGLALNWVYHNYITRRKAVFFGFIDHDIFPVRPTQIAPFLEPSPVFGLIQSRKEMWYLWPGFCFFRRDFLDGKNLDFLPGNGCDTGGGNWDSLYCLLDQHQVASLRHEYGNLRDGSDPQADLYEIIGDWVHTFNASNWKKVAPKDSIVKEFLAKY